MTPAPEPTLPRRFGRYELLELIGTGGMAEVFKARGATPIGPDQLLVVKTILPAYARNKAFVNMLIAEAKVTSLLEHANIVPIYELGEIRGNYYIAMELVDGADLLDVLARCTHEKLRVPTEIALHVVSEVCKGLAHAHAAHDADGRPLNIVHRDVSPSNILLGLDGVVKIMDFGVASADFGLDGAADVAHPSAALKGKLGYMSPEQVRGAPLDRRSDVFALGIILFECLTLKRLFLGKTDAQTLMNVRDASVEKKFKRHSYIPKPLRNILRRALARDPAHRFQTATDMQEAILDYLFDHRLRVSPRSLSTFLRQVLAPPRTAASPHARPDAFDPGPDDPALTSDDGPADAVPALPPALPSDAHTRRHLPRDLRRVDLSRATFHFRNVGEPAFGPIGFDRTAQLLQVRCIGPREWVSINGSDWIRAREVAALVDLHPALFEDEPDRPAFDGPLNRLRTPSLFHRVHADGLDGKLTLTHGTVLKEIYFQRGAPVFINSNLKSELFGAWLIKHHLATPEQVDRALDLSADPRSPLGDALVSQGVLTPDALATALLAQVRERLLEPLRWTTGWYEFFAGVMHPHQTPLPDAPLALVMAGLRAHYDLGALRRIFDPWLDKPLVVSRELADRTDALALTPGERAARAVIAANTTLSQLLRDHGTSEAARYDLLRVAFACHQLDLLTFRARAFG